MPDTLRRRNHVVSKFYLTNFADNNGRLTAVELPGTRTFPISAGDATVHKDYFVAVGVDGELTDVAERNFAEIENEAASAWALMRDGAWPLTPEPRLAVSAWVALQLLRGPSVRTSMSEIGTSMLQLQIAVGGRSRLREILRELGEPFDDESVDREWIDLFRDPLSLGVTSNHHLQHVGRSLPHITRSIYDRLWILTRFERRRLATSDHPVAVVPNRRFSEVGLGTGIENADEICLPVSRSMHLGLALRASLNLPLASSATDMSQAGSTMVASYCNDVTAKNARRYLFHHPDDSPLQGLDLPEPRTQETVSSGMTYWTAMSEGDRRLLLDAGVQPPPMHAEDGSVAPDS